MQSTMKTSLDYLARFDPEIAALSAQEYARQAENLELIASENIASPAVIAAMASALTNKYAEGLPGRRYYGGCVHVDGIERLAIARARTLFGAAYANVQPHSGTQANLAVYAALLQPGDTLLGMDLQSGGHLSHGAKVNLSGRLYRSVSYGVDPETGHIDYDRVEDLVKQHRPKLVVAGASAYPRQIDFAAFAEIAHRHGALLLVDMAHIAGLVAGGQHPSPVPYADVVTTTTHKTLRGPRGGMILSRDASLAKKLDSAVFPGAQGGPLMHVIAAKAVCFHEAMQPSFAAYAETVVQNAAALADGLLRRGLRLVSGGTDNHLLLCDLRGTGISGRELQERLDAVRITVNKNSVPGDPAGAGETSGIRIGTAAVTTRGFRPAEMDGIADCICAMIRDPEKNGAAAAARVQEMTRRHPLYGAAD